MHVEPRPPDRYPWWLRAVYRRQRQRYGAPLVPALVWGRRPRLFAAFSLLLAALDGPRSRLPPALRSLLMVRVSQLNHCEFCVDLNALRHAERAGAREQLRELTQWRTSRLYDDATRAALAYAEAITGEGCRVPAALHDALRPHFDDDAIVELTALIGFQNLSSRFNSALGLPAQGLCPLL